MRITDPSAHTATGTVARRIRPLVKRLLRWYDPRRLPGQLRPWWRRLTERRDRQRFPTAPTWVLSDPHHDHVAAAATGRAGLYIGATPRYATASGLVWTRPDIVSVAYLLTSSMVTYRIHRGAVGLAAEPISTIAGLDVLGDYSGIAASASGALMAVTSSVDGRLAVMRTDADGVPVPDSIVTVKVPTDRVVHGVAFSPDERYVVYTSILRGGGLRTVRVSNSPDGRLALELVAVIDTPEARLPPKGLRFSADGRHLLVSHGGSATSSPGRSSRGFVAVHEWDAETGRVGQCLDRSEARQGIKCAEDVTLLADDSMALVTDQFDDSAHLIRIDRATGRLSEGRKVVSWAAGGLTMPHGCATSPDGTTVAITNYGDGSVRFFDVASLVTDATPRAGGRS